MIPKIIHYCWFGHNPLPESAKKCIESWKKYLPGYEIKEWNESNFNVNAIPYTEEAYRLKKYAFVSDYARFWILYHYGGLYFDTDVEVIKAMDDIINRGAFMGLEQMPPEEADRFAVAPGLGLGCRPHHPFYKEVLSFYEGSHFASWKGQMTGTVVTHVSRLLLSRPLEYRADGIIHYEGIYIYPTDYFDPFNYYTREMTITDNTRSIHHYSASWSIRGIKMTIIDKIKRRLSFISCRLLVTIKTHLR